MVDSASKEWNKQPLWLQGRYLQQVKYVCLLLQGLLSSKATYVEISRLRANWSPSFLLNITDSSAASRLGFEAIDNIRVISNGEMTGPNVDCLFDIQFKERFRS